jgi:hypothetical protein
MKYAQIINGKVHGVFEYDPLPDFAPNIVMILVDGLPFEPKSGWFYDGEDFSEPEPAPAPDYGSRISRLAFKLRMTADERKAIRVAAESNADLYDFMDLLSDSTYIDLTDPQTIYGVTLLESAELLTKDRAYDLLNNPVTGSEKWEG